MVVRSPSPPKSPATNYCHVPWRRHQRSFSYRLSASSARRYPANPYGNEMYLTLTGKMKEKQKILLYISPSNFHFLNFFSVEAFVEGMFQGQKRIIYFLPKYKGIFLIII
jgi:hypothetical protein